MTCATSSDQQALQAFPLSSSLSKGDSTSLSKNQQGKLQKKPEWLKVKLPTGAKYHWIKEQAKTHQMATVCQEARCPNIGECWTVGTATFMVMGDTCTRGCRFCAVKTGNPNGWLDADEPKNLANTIQQAGWKYVVLTSVDRDDLPDGGAGHFAACITQTRALNPETLVEVLIPDFQGNHDHLQLIMDAEPDVIAQNIETVERLTHTVRDRRAGYQQTLDCLAYVKAQSPTIFTKSSIMLGLGETDAEVRQCLADLRAHGVDIVTLGQYLQPSPKQLEVKEFIRPEAFDAWKRIAEEEFGFLYCASGPLVRSSYKAGEFFMAQLIQNRRLASSDPMSDRVKATLNHHHRQETVQ